MTAGISGCRLPITNHKETPMTSEKGARIIQAIEVWLKPENLNITDHPDLMVEGSDGMAIFYDHNKLLAHEDAEEDAVVKQQLAKVISSKLHRTVKVIGSIGLVGYCNVWFKYELESKPSASSADGSKVA